MPSGHIELIDRHVGARIKGRRKELRLSQTRLGHVLGVSYQQIQKYEQGTDRLGAGALYHIAARLGVSVGYLYDGASTLIGATGFADAEQQQYTQPAALLRSRWDRAFEEIRDEKRHELIVQLAEALGQAPAQADPEGPAEH